MEVNIINGDKITVELIGRLDTASVTDFDEEIAEVIADDNDVVFDCKDLEYISSSGLRIFLTLRKADAAKGGKIIVQDIKDDIRNVFMMTGFLNLFEIR